MSGSKTKPQKEKYVTTFSVFDSFPALNHKVCANTNNKKELTREKKQIFYRSEAKDFDVHWKINDCHSLLRVNRQCRTNLSCVVLDTEPLLLTTTRTRARCVDVCWTTGRTHARRQTLPTHPSDTPQRTGWQLLLCCWEVKAAGLSAAYLSLGFSLCACPAATVRFLNKWSSCETRGWRTTTASLSRPAQAFVLRENHSLSLMDFFFFPT